jgi:hypothetical protein
MSIIEAFGRAIAEMEQHARRLESAIDLFPATSAELEWSHVADIEFVNERLQEIVRRFFPHG